MSEYFLQRNDEDLVLSYGPTAGHRMPYHTRMGLAVFYRREHLVDDSALEPVAPGMVGIDWRGERLMAVDADGVVFNLPLRVEMVKALDGLEPLMVLRDMVRWFEAHDADAPELGPKNFLARAKELLAPEEPR